MSIRNPVSLRSIVLYDTVATSYKTSIKCSRRLHIRGRPKCKRVDVGDGFCQAAIIISFFVLFVWKIWIYFTQYYGIITMAHLSLPANARQPYSDYQWVKIRFAFLESVL